MILLYFVFFLWLPRTRSSVDGKSEGCDYPQPVFNNVHSTSWTSAAAHTTPNNKVQYSRTTAADISDLGIFYAKLTLNVLQVSDLFILNVNLLIFFF